MTVRIPKADYMIEETADEWIFNLKSPSEIVSPIYLSEEEMNDAVTGSKILECHIILGDKVISTAKKYQKIVKDIWDAIPLEDVHAHSTYTFFSKEYQDALPKGDKRNQHLPLNLYFRSKNSEGAFEEILKMVKHYQMTLEMTIVLDDAGHSIRYFKC
jgi:hypothetical protein